MSDAALTHDDRVELINRRRHQILVHSILYYRLDSTLVPDATFDAWGRELAALQREDPEASEAVEYQLAAFRNYTGNTGFDLPLDDPGATEVAQRLLAEPRQGQPDQIPEVQARESAAPSA